MEDFIQAHPGYVYRSIDAIFGLGAITVKDTTADKVVEAAFLPYQMNLLSRMERNRLELYLKVLELQDQLIAEQRAALR